jgi:hypothetical protein
VRSDDGSISQISPPRLADTRHGSGTDVAFRYAYGLGHLRSSAADLAAGDAQITTRLLAADTVAAPDDVGAGLGAAGEAGVEAAGVRCPALADHDQATKRIKLAEAVEDRLVIELAVGMQRGDHPDGVTAAVSQTRPRV